MSLDTLSNVKARLNITTSADDALLTTLLGAASEWVRAYCGRDLEGGVFIEDHPGSSAFVFLRNFPVDDVAAVHVDAARQFGDDTLLPADAYVVHADRGVVQRLDGPFLPAARTELLATDLRAGSAAPQTVRVEYSSSAAVNDLKSAFARLVAAWYRQTKTETAAGFINVSQQKVGDTFVIYGPGDAGVPAEVVALLAPYRVPPV